jgi:hypothetical protein
MSVLWTIAGTILLFAGALNATLALTAETCTGGAADSLSGGIITIVFYTAGFFVLARTRSRPTVIAVAVLPMLAAIGHSVFALHFLAGYVNSGMTSCQAMTGDPYGADGREAFHIALWCATGVVFWAGLMFAAARANRGMIESERG